MLGLTLHLNDLHDTIGMTHNRFTDSRCVYLSKQVVHTELIKVVRPGDSAFKSLSKMSHEPAVTAVITALMSEKNKSRKKRQKIKVDMKPRLKRKKNLGFYETLIEGLQLEDESNKSYLRMTSENSADKRRYNLRKH